MRVATTISLFLFLSVGCTDSKVSNDLEKRVKELESSSASTNERLKSLERDITNIRVLSNLNEDAYLVPSAEGYSIIKWDLGIMTVRLMDVQPYANGSRVTLLFGNISGASINGLKARVKWGRVDKDGLPDLGSEKSRDVAFEKKLRGSSWTSIPIVLEGIPPAQLGYVEVSNLSHSGIELTR